MNQLWKEKSFVPEMNRPGFELAGFFKHTDFRRIILFGEKEISFVKEMSKESQLACFSKLANDETPCIIIAERIFMSRNF